MHVQTFGGRSVSESDIATKAARSALVQRRRGSKDDARDLYYLAHSLLRTLRNHLEGFRPAA